MSNQLYTITSDLFGDGTATLEQLTALVAGMDNGDMWGYELQIHGNEARMYASRYDSEKATPTRYDNWVMINYDEGYLVIAEAIETPAPAPVEDDNTDDEPFDRLAFYRKHPSLAKIVGVSIEYPSKDDDEYEDDTLDDGDAAYDAWKDDGRFND